MVMINLPSSPLAALARFSWPHSDGFSWIQPMIASTNQNVCYKNTCFVENM